MVIPSVHRSLTIIATVVGVLVTFTPAVAAANAGTATQLLIENHLEKYPGGRQINATEISYNEGQFVMTFTKTAFAQVGADCSPGWFCFYDGVNYGYPRGRLSSCGWQDLAWWGWQNRTESVHYNTSGSVNFEHHAAALNHNSDYVLFSASSMNRHRPDVSPNRNRADHVFRKCPAA